MVLSSVSYGAQFKTYVIYDDEEVQENKFLTFVVPQKPTGMEKLSCLIRQKEIKRNFHIKLAEDEKKLERCLKKITKNWKRDIAPDRNIESKIIKGYDGELDKKFKRKLWFKLRRGEKTC